LNAGGSEYGAELDYDPYVRRDQEAGHAVCCIHAQHVKDQSNDVHNRSRDSTHLVNPDPILSVSKATPIPHNNNREDRNPIRKNAQKILAMPCTFASSPPPPDLMCAALYGALEGLLYANKPKAEHITKRDMNSTQLVADESRLLGFYVVSTSQWLSTFRADLVPSKRRALLIG